MNEVDFSREAAGLPTVWYSEEELPQGSEAWEAKRQEHLTATDIAHVQVGGSPTLLHKKKNRGYKVFVTAAMRMGTKFEAVARAVHNQHFPKAEPWCASKGILWASLDGWDAENREILEIKCVSRGRESSMWADVEEGRCPERVYWQAQVQMAVTGAKRTRLFVYDPERTLWLHHYIHADKRDQAVMHVVAEQLWLSLQERVDAPFVAAAQKWAEAKEALEAARADEEAARAEVSELMGASKFAAGGGITATKSVRQGAIDVNAMVEGLRLGNVSLDHWRKPGVATLTIQKEKSHV